MLSTVCAQNSSYRGRLRVYTRGARVYTGGREQTNSSFTRIIRVMAAAAPACLTKYCVLARIIYYRHVIVLSVRSTDVKTSISCKFTCLSVHLAINRRETRPLGNECAGLNVTVQSSNTDQHTRTSYRIENRDTGTGRWTSLFAHDGGKFVWCFRLQIFTKQLTRTVIMIINKNTGYQKRSSKICLIVKKKSETEKYPRFSVFLKKKKT